jgi:hypothetical protein
MYEQETRIKHDRSIIQALENAGLLKLFHNFCAKAVDNL